jgi:hypothetical protein
MRSSLIFSLSMTALLALAPTCLFAQGRPIEAGQYFGVFDCGASPRAELISIIKQNDSTAVRVRTFPVNGGPYFQWHDALYQVDAAGDGPLASVKSVYVRQTVGDDAAPAELLLQPADDGGIVRLESGTLCGGNLSRLDAAAASPSDFADILQGTIAHLSTGRSGTERVNENTDPRPFPIEILSTVDEFGSFITMRLDGEGRTCLFSAQPAAGTALERRLIHGVGDCSDGTVTFTERGPMLVLDWGGGYRELAGALGRQDQLIAKFLSELGSPAQEAGNRPGADAQSATASDVELDGVKSAFSGLGWTIGTVPLGLGMEESMSVGAPGVRLNMRNWVARGQRGVQAGAREEPDFVNFGVTDIHGLTDRTVLQPAHWHMGSLVFRVEKRVNSNKPELMPTKEALIAAVIEKFGPPISLDSRSSQAGWFPSPGSELLLYPVKNGELYDGPCFDPDMGHPMMETNEEVYNRNKAVVVQIETGGYCEGVLAVRYTEGGMGRLDSYSILARDFLLEARNEVNDLEVQVKLLDEQLEQMPEVKPEL